MLPSPDLYRDADGGTQFRPTCGNAMMRTGGRDRISVDARSVAGIDIITLGTARYDGRNLMPPSPLIRDPLTQDPRPRL